MINIRKNIFETNSSSMHSFIVTNKKSDTLTPENIKQIINEYNNNSKDMDWDKYEKICDILGFSPCSYNDNEPPKIEYNEWDYNNELNFYRAPMRILTTTAEKLAYLIASYNSYFSAHNIADTKKYLEEDILPLMRKYIPNLEIIYPHISCDTNYDFYKDKDGNLYEAFNVYDKNNKNVAFIKKTDTNIKPPFYFKNVISYTNKGEEITEKIEVTPITDEKEYREIKYYGDVDHQSCNLLKNSFEQLKINVEEYLFNPKYVVITDGDEYEDFKKLQLCGLIPDDAIKIQIF